jgi:DNA-binding response OmpR family regulator
MNNETILVVDDSQEIISFLTKRALEPRGFRVLTALNGQAGLDLAIQHDPDLIMLDMSMPQMTGIEMLQALRQTLCQSPVIFMTMYGSEQVAVEAFRLGVRDYISKPFTVEDVQAAVESALQEKRLAKEKDLLLHDLISSETIRKTVVTLSHYINNDLFIVSGGLDMLAKHVSGEALDPDKLAKIVKDSQLSTERIAAVMRVLKRVINAEPATYHGDVQMIDIEQALKEEMKRRTGQLR